MRLLAFGDSFVAGAGDPDHLGWVGRALAGRREVTLYNLGVRRETSADIAARWRAEAGVRWSEAEPMRLLFSFGSNDCNLETGSDQVRIAPAQALKHAQDFLAVAASRAPTLLVGPPPAADPGVRQRAGALNAQLQALAARLKVPFIDVHARLAAEPVWMAEVAGWDGAHPGAAGYQLMADLVAAHPAWRRFLGD